MKTLINTQQIQTMPVTIDNEYITTREASKILGVTIRTVQNWVDSGKLFAKLTLGGHRRLLRKEVTSLAKQSNEQSQEQALVKNTSLTASRINNTTNSLLRVLAVEDNSDLLNLYKLRFSTFNFPHELFTAEDGVQGLFKIGRYSPHLLLIDLLMPNMNGFQMLRTLQSMPESSDLKIIVITGLTASEIREGGGLPPGVALLPKPVPFDTLEALCMQRAVELDLMNRFMN